ncbi:MAG: rRNA maturation RNase YbeY [bacterium]
MSDFPQLIKQIVQAEKKEGEINLLFVDDKEIHRLNKQYRDKDKPTDVLSFEMNEDGVIGDIAISKETAERQAKEYGATLDEEIKRLVVHGTLHLLGYDHGEEMKNAEKTYEKY